MTTLWHLARWIAWQLGEHGARPTHPPARITVFSSGRVEDF